MKKIKQIFKWLRTQHLAFWILGTLAVVSGTWCEITSKPYITVGDSGYGSSINDLSGALTAIGSTSCTLVVPKGASCPADASHPIPATCNLRVEKGGMITIANGVTFSINGRFAAGDYQVFTCTGTGNVHFGKGVIEKCLASWWGTDSSNNNSFDNAVPFQKAIDSIHNVGSAGWETQTSSCTVIFVHAGAVLSG